ncbi:MAG: pantoate--beta-alanine ligase [Lentisphaeria bacterium]|nr:pantoate--beta-alanine ligase [Lentisphaeria bacterium]
MIVFRTKAELARFASETRRAGKVIGLVPTMGYLHAGHMSLVDTARSKADVVIVTLFVNPTQFGPNEDLDRYPRDFERDRKMCEEHGVDVLFAPEAAEMYAPGSSTWIEETDLARPLCGASRPGFYRGVTTVVGKLFHLAQPDFACFGLKDAQQCFVIERMVRDLDFQVKIVPCPLIRDADGLALSSRNRYLSADERSRALSIHKALLEGRRALEEQGTKDVSGICAKAAAAITAAGGRVDYVEALDRATLKAPTAETREVLLAAAAFFGTTRLIDNELVELEA